MWERKKTNSEGQRGFLLWNDTDVTVIPHMPVGIKAEFRNLSCAFWLTTCLLCAEARALPSSVQLRAAFISSTSSFSIFSFWASCWLLRDNRESGREPSARCCGETRAAAKPVSHSGLVAQLLVLLCQLLVAVLHAVQHLLHLFHLFLELLVAHLEVSHTMDQLWCLTDGASTEPVNVYLALIELFYIFNPINIEIIVISDELFWSDDNVTNTLAPTYNSALETSPPKASRLPEVILSSIDLLAKTQIQITLKLQTSVHAERFEGHSPHTLSLSLTDSWVMSLVSSSL